jgi:hypothetical protein
VYEKDLAGALAHVAVRKGARGFTFDDLTRVASTRMGATIGQVADWLANARASGFVDDLGFDPGLGRETLGPRRYALARGAAQGQADPLGSRIRSA